MTDSSGNALTGLEWTTSDPTIVSLSTDDPPILAAVAPGTAIVYVVGMPVLVTVYSGTSLPAGTPIWSVPRGNGGAGSVTIAPAVPSASGADLFTLDTSYTLTALASDGSTVWKAPAGTTLTSGPSTFLVTSIVPDFTGSALLKSIDEFIDSEGFHQTHIVQQVNAATGQLSNLYTFSSAPYFFGGNYFDDAGSTQAVIPHPSGTLFIQDNATVSVIDPTGVQPTVSVTLENSTSITGTYAPQLGRMIVAGDGNAYLPYYFFNETATQAGWQTVTNLMALVVTPTGSYQKIALGTGEVDWTFGSGGCETASGTDFYIPPPNSGGNSVITNADQGAAVFADVIRYTAGSCTFSTQQTLQVSYVSQSGLTSQANLAVNAFVPALQREDGSYIGTDGYNNLIALGLDGSVVWQQALPSTVAPLYATADGGAIVTTTQPVCPPGDISFALGSIVCQESAYPTPLQSGYGQLGTLYTVDQNGNVTSQTPDTGMKYSWKGAYATAGDPQVQAVSPNFEIATIALSHAAAAGGNLTGNGFSLAHHTFGLVFCGSGWLDASGNWHGGDGPCPHNIMDVTFSYVPGINDENSPEAYDPSNDFSKEYTQWVDTIKNNALASYRAAFTNLPAIVRAKPTLSILNGGPNTITSFEHTVYVTGYWMGPGVYPRLQASYPPNGWTSIGNPYWSQVYYLPIMGNAQIGLGDFSKNPFVPWSPIYSLAPMNLLVTAEFQELVSTIGTVIGSVSAHETGHQLGLPNMDCDDPDNPYAQSCPSGDKYVYNYYASDGTCDWWYTGTPPLKWSHNAECSLQQYLLPGSPCQ